MNKKYKSYIILDITNDEKIEKIKNDNDNEIAFLDLRKRIILLQVRIKVLKFG